MGSSSFDKSTPTRKSLKVSKIDLPETDTSYFVVVRAYLASGTSQSEVIHIPRTVEELLEQLLKRLVSKIDLTRLQ